MSGRTAPTRARRIEDRRLLGAVDAARAWVRASAGRRIAAAGVALVVAAASALYLTDRVLFPPDQPVRQLFAALAAGDGATAARVAGCAGHPLCSAAALRRGYRAPTDLRIDQVARAGGMDTAYVAVSYRLAGRATRASVLVARPGGLRRRWTIVDGGFGMVTVVSPVVRRAQVGGAAVAVAAVSGAPGEPALPGVYDIAGSADDAMFTASDPAVAVAATRADDGRTTEVVLTVAIRPEVVAEVQAQVDAALDACAASADDVVHAGCPFQARGDGVAYHVGDDVTWRMTLYPRIALRISDDPAADGGPLVVRTVVPGVAVATWPGGGGVDDVVPDGVVAVGQDGAPLYHG